MGTTGDAAPLLFKTFAETRMSHAYLPHHSFLQFATAFG